MRWCFGWPQPTAIKQVKESYLVQGQNPLRCHRCTLNLSAPSKSPATMKFPVRMALISTLPAFFSWRIANISILQCRLSPLLGPEGSAALFALPSYPLPPPPPVPPRRSQLWVGVGGPRS
ncbi:hypothetical protein SEVIR_6G017401v4 [Setaria viridis]